MNHLDPCPNCRRKFEHLTLSKEADIIRDWHIQHCTTGFYECIKCMGHKKYGEEIPEFKDSIHSEDCEIKNEKK